MIETLTKNTQAILESMPTGANEVVGVHSADRKVIFEGTDFALSANNSTSMYGIRTIQDGRFGFTTTNSDEIADLLAAAQEAQSVAKLAVPSPHHQIASQKGKNQDFELFDEAVDQVGAKQLYELAEFAVAEARKDKRVAIDRAEIKVGFSYDVTANSNGIRHRSKITAIGWSAMGMARANGEVTSFDYDGGMVWRLKDAEAQIRRTMTDFRESVLGSLGARKIKSYRGRVLLHPQAVLDFIGDTVETNCNGIGHQDGLSSWRGKVGELVSSEGLNVFEDPSNKNRPEGWAPFDREGVLTQKHYLIRDGKLNFVAHNCFSAHREGVDPTGNASGGARSVPGLGFSNMGIEASARTMTVSDADLNGKLGNGLVVKRFSGNADPTSGNFSGVAKNSWWVEKGERAYPVNEVMISGNLFELLKSIELMGKTAHQVYGGGQAPYLIVDGVSVTAG